MVTNKGIFLAALILGLCIVLASVITGAALCKSGRMKGANCWQQSCERGDREEGENREFRGGREDREEGEEGEDREFRGGREGREEGEEGEDREFRGGREDREEGEEGENREFRGGRENRDLRGNRRYSGHNGCGRGERHGGGGATLAEPTGTGYLFN